jgi:hypothetical protein
MSTLEAALRGGAVVILLLRAVVHARSGRGSRLSRYSVLLLTGIAANVVASAPGFGGLDPRWTFPIRIVGAGAPAAFWMVMGGVLRRLLSGAVVSRSRLAGARPA